MMEPVTTVDNWVPTLGSPVGQCRTGAPDLFHLRARELGLLHQLLAVPGQSISRPERASSKETLMMAVRSCARDSGMGLTGQ